MTGGLSMPNGNVQDAFWNISSLLELGMYSYYSSTQIWLSFPTCRDQSTDQGMPTRMPTRLLELVRNYLCTQGLSPPTTDLQLLPYPRFTTPLHSALFV